MFSLHSKHKLRDNCDIETGETDLGRKTFKVQGVAKLLGISVDSVRRDADEAGLQIERQGGSGPKTRIFTVENVFDLAAHRARKYGFTPKNETHFDRLRTEGWRRQDNDQFQHRLYPCLDGFACPGHRSRLPSQLDDLIRVRP